MCRRTEELRPTVSPQTPEFRLVLKRARPSTYTGPTLLRILVIRETARLVAFY